jgi:uncharacterized OB-fold protein
MNRIILTDIIETDMKKAKNEYIKFQMPEKDYPQNWFEDMSHENGNYVNFCKRCGRYFIGHKRRVICKECANETKNN